MRACVEAMVAVPLVVIRQHRCTPVGAGCHVEGLSIGVSGGRSSLFASGDRQAAATERSHRTAALVVATGVAFGLSARRRRLGKTAPAVNCNAGDGSVVVQDNAGDGDSNEFRSFAEFVLEAQAAILDGAEAAEVEAAGYAAKPPGVQAAPARFLREPWSRGGSTPGSPKSHGVTAVMEDGLLWEKAAASVSVVRGRLSRERAESLSTDDGPAYREGEMYCAAALSLVFHARSPLVPTLRGDVRLFELPGRGERWFGGGADLTPVYLFEEDAVDFHSFWRDVCRNAISASPSSASSADPSDIGDRLYAEMKKTCDEYFYIPARKEHRGVGGIFFDRLRDKHIHGLPMLAEPFVRKVAEGFLPSYLPIVKRRCREEASEAMREWQLVRRGRYVEFNLLYDRGVRFGLAQLEKVMVSAPPLVRWRYNGPEAEPCPGEDKQLMEVVRRPREWAFATDEGELIEFLHDSSADAVGIAGVLPRKIVMRLGSRFRGIGVLTFDQDGEDRNRRLLCHRRSDTKATYPGRWDMLVGGVPRVGESALEAATRELREELGIDARAAGGQLCSLGISCEVGTDVVKCVCEVFGYAAPKGLHAAPGGDGEVAEAAWRTAGDVRAEVNANKEGWVPSGLQVWEAIEAAGGPDFAAERCAQVNH